MTKKYWEYVMISIPLAASILWIVVYVIGDPNVNGVNPEMECMWYISQIGGFHFGLTDFLQFFKNALFGENSRIRFLSYLLLVFDTKTRFWLFENIKFIPFFSLNWLFPYFLSPIFIFSFIKNRTRNLLSATVTTALFLISMGNLSSSIMIFHPAKSLTTFFFIFCLWSFERLMYWREVKRKKWLYYGLTFAALSLGSFSDETFFFIHLAVPLIFLKEFRQKGVLRIYCGLFCFQFLVFVVLVTWILPPIILSLSKVPYDFWQFAIVANTGLKKISLDDYFSNAFNLFKGHFNWASDQEATHLYANLPVRRAMVVLISYVGILSYLFGTKRALQRLILILIFTVFQTLILSRAGGNPGLGNPYYMGVLSSVLFVVSLSECFMNHHCVGKNIFTMLLAVYLFWSFPKNFMDANYQFRRSLMTKFQPTTQRLMEPNNQLTWDMFQDIWKQRKTRSVQVLMKDAPREIIWLRTVLLFHQAGPEGINILPDYNKWGQK